MKAQATRTQTKAQTYSVFGFLIALPAAVCAMTIAHFAYTVNQELLAMTFTLLGAAMAYGGTQLK